MAAHNGESSMIVIDIIVNAQSDIEINSTFGIVINNDPEIVLNGCNGLMRLGIVWKGLPVLVLPSKAPGVVAFKFETLSPKPKTPNSKPKNPNPKPKTLNPKTLNP